MVEVVLVGAFGGGGDSEQKTWGRKDVQWLQRCWMQH